MRALFVFAAVLVITAGLYGFHVLHIPHSTAVVARCNTMHRPDGCKWGTFKWAGPVCPAAGPVAE
jgi:hypothetical protein